MNDEYFNKLTKITDENIKDFYSNSTLFIVIKNNNLKKMVLGHFNTMPRFIRGNMYTIIQYENNSHRKYNAIFKSSETDDEYKERISNTKSNIKSLIKEGTLYGKRT